MVQIKLSTAFVLAAATMASVVARPIGTATPPATTSPLASEGLGDTGSLPNHGPMSFGEGHHGAQAHHGPQPHEGERHFSEEYGHMHGPKAHFNSLLPALVPHGHVHQPLLPPPPHFGSPNGMTRRDYYADGLVVRDEGSSVTPPADSSASSATSHPNAGGAPPTPLQQNVAAAPAASRIPASTPSHPGKPGEGQEAHEGQHLHNAGPNNHHGQHERPAGENHHHGHGDNHHHGHDYDHHHHGHGEDIPHAHNDLKAAEKTPLGHHGLKDQPSQGVGSGAAGQGKVKEAASMGVSGGKPSASSLRRRSYQDLEDMFRRSMEDLEFHARGFEDEFYLD